MDPFPTHSIKKNKKIRFNLPFAHVVTFSHQSHPSLSPEEKMSILFLLKMRSKWVIQVQERDL